MLSAAGLLNNRAQTERKPPSPGSPRLLLVAGKHLALPYGLQTDVYRQMADGAGRFLTESKTKLRRDDPRWIHAIFAR
jgi:hypothetical protein